MKSHPQKETAFESFDIFFFSIVKFCCFFLPFFPLAFLLFSLDLDPFLCRFGSSNYAFCHAYGMDFWFLCPFHQDHLWFHSSFALTVAPPSSSWWIPLVCNHIPIIQRSCWWGLKCSQCCWVLLPLLTNINYGMLLQCYWRLLFGWAAELNICLYWVHSRQSNCWFKQLWDSNHWIDEFLWDNPSDFWALSMGSKTCKSL